MFLSAPTWHWPTYKSHLFHSYSFITYGRAPHATVCCQGRIVSHPLQTGLNRSARRNLLPACWPAVIQKSRGVSGGGSQWWRRQRHYFKLCGRKQHEPLLYLTQKKTDKPEWTMIYCWNRDPWVRRHYWGDPTILWGPAGVYDVGESKPLGVRFTYCHAGKESLKLQRKDHHWAGKEWNQSKEAALRKDKRELLI